MFYIIPIATTGVALFVRSRILKKERGTLCDALREQNGNVPQGERWAYINQAGSLDLFMDRLESLEEKYQRFIKTKIDPLFGAVRETQMQNADLDMDDIQTTPHERSINRNLSLSIFMTSVALATVPLHPLIQFVSCVPMALYLIKDKYKLAYNSIKQQNKSRLPILQSLSLTMLWLGGYYIAGGLLFIFVYGGQKLGLITEDRSHKELINVFGKQPRYVWILSDSVEVDIPFEQLQVGDILVISAGQMIPADGMIIKGNASIDQHRLTGESQPVDREIGDTVLAATVVLAGHIHVEVDKAGQETVAAQVGEMLSKTASYQMNLTTKAQKVADASVIPTLAVAALAGLTVGYVGMAAIATSVFGLNLYWSGPVALLTYLNIASRNRILIKDGRSLELLKTIDTIVFDKTGTLTLERPHVTQIHTFTSIESDVILGHAATVEQKQTHPIARAILAFAEEQDIWLSEMDDARYEMGYGIQAVIDGALIRVGSDRFMAHEEISLTEEVTTLQNKCHAVGNSLVMVAIDDQLAGAIELEPTIRPEAKTVIDDLRQRNIDCLIISGDQEGPTRKLAQSLGIDNYFANTLPEHKAQLVEQLQDKGHSVCFVGDGINDSIALKKANVSISLSGAATIATDTAQIVLMDESLVQLPLLFQLAEEMDANLRTIFALSILPSLGIWGGVFFLHLGVVGAAAIFEASLWVGVATALRPLLTHNQIANSSS